MTALARLLEQRCRGEIRLRMERDGIAVLQEAGSSKVRLPRGSQEAILINTSGGLAGGDDISIDAIAGKDAELTLTTQSAERVYRSLGPPATCATRLQAHANARLHWLPQETILFDGASLKRNFTVDLGEGAEFLAIEPVIIGRKEMGETVKRMQLSDHWDIRRNGKLVHADRLAIDGSVPSSAATLNGALAFATVMFVSENAADKLDHIRQSIGHDSGASAWNGKLIARLISKDGFTLRKQLIAVLSAILGQGCLPKVWTF